MKLVSSWISIGLVIALLAPSFVLAEGPGGSVTYTIVDPDTGKAIPDHLIRPGMKVRIIPHAMDGMGRTVPCGSSFEKANGPAGNQIDDVLRQPDDSAIMTMGSGFGAAAVKLKCNNLPDVETKNVNVVNNTLAGGKPSVFNQPPAAQATPAAGAEPAAAEGAASSASASAATGILLGVAVAAGVAALVVGLSSSASTTCTQPNLWCRTPDTCCPPGYFYYCTTPAAKVGCYNDVFIDGCNLKYGCSSEY